MTTFQKQLLDTAKEAALIGGKILLSGYGQLKPSQVGIKAMGDYVTDLDNQSEEAIIQRIRKTFPEHVIQAEESGLTQDGCCYRWVIDPLDGTANYVQNIPIFAVSIACLADDTVEIGTVFDPRQEEMFWAVRNGGAYLNGKPIKVSERKEMAYSMLASGFPWRSKCDLDAYMASFKDLFLMSAGIRRMGSAALDLAYTSCGRFDGFWEMRLKPWDIAAGLLLVQEAGGRVSDFHGADQYFKTGNIVAGNPHIHKHILEVTQKYLFCI
jgi:myo-inositol-1(or 4)-monophosphatase